MKLIPLTQGQVALVSDEDFAWLSQYKWCVLAMYGRSKHHGRYLVGYYARRRDTDNKTILMHRLITKAPAGMEVDHINHNRLDNRRENLRIVTTRQNQQNSRKQRTPTSSKYKGVSFCKRDKKYKGQITIEGHRRHLGHTPDEGTAAMLYNEAALKYFGPHAYLNEAQQD